MIKTSDGGPAFPTNEVVSDGRLTPVHGMTLRDYFAATAPETPAYWHGLDTKPQYPPHPEGLNAASPDFERRIETFKKTVAEYEARCEEWTVSRYYSWRWAYADAMLAERAKGGSE